MFGMFFLGWMFIGMLWLLLVILIELLVSNIILMFLVWLVRVLFIELLMIFCVRWFGCEVLVYMLGWCLIGLRLERILILVVL